MSVSQTDKPGRSIWGQAFGDIGRSLRLASFWWSLAVQNVRGKYNRTALGVLWVPISYTLVVGTIGYIFSLVIDRDPIFMLPYIAAGFATWGLIVNAMTGGATVFIRNRKFIHARPLPLFMFVLAHGATLLLQLAIELPLFFVFAVIVGREVGWVALWAIPGLALLMFNALWVSLFFGILVARFRDLNELLANAVRPLFLCTPVIWSIDINPRVEGISEWNPFYHALELVRGPLMGAPQTELTWIFMGAAAAIGWPVTLVMFVFTRNRLASWI